MLRNILGSFFGAGYGFGFDFDSGFDFGSGFDFDSGFGSGLNPFAQTWQEFTSSPQK
jgi:hypothetical protein